MGSTEAGYAIYWKAWAVLLALTVTMVFAPGGAPMVAAAILVKAGIIGAWFMHLRYERAALSVAVVVVTLATALVLIGLIAIDAVRP